MLQLYTQYEFWSNSNNFLSRKHEFEKVIAFEVGDLLFLFNFHPNRSFNDYRIGYANNSNTDLMKIILSSDDKEFGGYDRIDKNTEYRLEPIVWDTRKASLLVYLPSRTCLIFAPNAK
jgi:1,4-alpha-glucan branching enzyme